MTSAAADLRALRASGERLAALWLEAASHDVRLRVAPHVRPPASASAAARRPSPRAAPLLAAVAFREGDRRAIQKREEWMGERVETRLRTLSREDAASENWEEQTGPVLVSAAARAANSLLQELVVGGVSESETDERRSELVQTAVELGMSEKKKPLFPPRHSRCC
jgi:hypothetical protein